MAEERAQKAEARAKDVDAAYDVILKENCRLRTRAKELEAEWVESEGKLAEAQDQVKELEEALGGQHTTRIVEDAIASADQNKTKDQRDYAVRVLEEAQNQEEDEAMRLEMKGLWDSASDARLLAGSFEALADRIKAGKA